MTQGASHGIAFVTEGRLGLEFSFDAQWQVLSCAGAGPLGPSPGAGKGLEHFGVGLRASTSDSDATLGENALPD